VKVKSTLLAALSVALMGIAPLAGAQEQLAKPAAAPQAAKATAAAQRTQATATAGKDSSARGPAKSNRAVPPAPEPVSTKPKSGEFDSGCHHSKDSDA
jgi:hypothetical protein